MKKHIQKTKKVVSNFLYKKHYAVELLFFLSFLVPVFQVVKWVFFSVNPQYPFLGIFVQNCPKLYNMICDYFDFFLHFSIAYIKSFQDMYHIQGDPKVSERFFKNGCGIQMSQATPTKFSMLFKHDYG